MSAQGQARRATHLGRPSGHRGHQRRGGTRRVSCVVVAGPLGDVADRSLRPGDAPWMTHKHGALMAAVPVKWVALRQFTPSSQACAAIQAADCASTGLARQTLARPAAVIPSGEPGHVADGFIRFFRGQVALDALNQLGDGDSPAA